MNDEQQKDVPTNRSIIDGTLAQMLGGALAILLVTTLSSFGHYLPAGFESACGTVVSIALYVGFKKLQQR